MTLLEIYQRAEQQGIEIDDFKMKEIISASFPEGWIVIDSSRVKSSLEEKVILAHELGHCETGSFYNVKSRLNTRGRCEYKADSRAISMLVPEDDFFDAVQRGYIECWDLADYFNVTCEFMKKAMEYYYPKYLEQKRVGGLND